MPLGFEALCSGAVEGRVARFTVSTLHLSVRFSVSPLPFPIPLPFGRPNHLYGLHHAMQPSPDRRDRAVWAGLQNILPGSLGSSVVSLIVGLGIPDVSSRPSSWLCLDLPREPIKWAPTFGSQAFACHVMRRAFVSIPWAVLKDIGKDVTCRRIETMVRGPLNS